MNFNYNSGRNFVNYQSKGQKVEKKVKEEEKKQEEVKKEESIKQRTIAPKSEKVTAKSEELISNYIKGAIQMNKPDRAAAAQQTGSVPDVQRDVNIDDLIAQWENLPDEATYEGKMNLLTQIIDTYENDLHDTYSARIWRVRRHAVNREYDMQNRLQFIQDHPNGGYTSGPELISYDGYNADCSAYYNFRDNYSALEPEQRAAFDDCISKYYANQILIDIISAHKDGQSNPDSLKNNAKKYANKVMYNMNLYVNNPFNENEPWQETYTEYKEKFEDFMDILENPTNSSNYVIYHVNEGGSLGDIIYSTIQNRVDELKGLIDNLRGQGFPLCDELLIAIQGHLFFAGHEDIDVLPYPEGEEGGAKQEAAKVKLKQSFVQNEK